MHSSTVDSAYRGASTPYLASLSPVEHGAERHIKVPSPEAALVTDDDSRKRPVDASYCQCCDAFAEVPLSHGAICAIDGVLVA